MFMVRNMINDKGLDLWAPRAPYFCPNPNMFIKRCQSKLPSFSPWKFPNKTEAIFTTHMEVLRSKTASPGAKVSRHCTLISPPSTGTGL